MRMVSGEQPLAIVDDGQRGVQALSPVYSEDVHDLARQCAELSGHGIGVEVVGVVEQQPCGLPCKLGKLADASPQVNLQRRRGV